MIASHDGGYVPNRRDMRIYIVIEKQRKKEREEKRVRESDIYNILIND